MSAYEGLAVLVPVLNELGEVTAWLRHASALLPGARLVVADGGSRDGSVEAVRSLIEHAGKRGPDLRLDGGRIQVLDSEQGRGTQLANAAEAALSDPSVTHLLAFHVDTALTRAAADSIAAAIRDPAFGWGWFDVRLDGPAMAERIIETAVSWRARLTGRPTGEQALLVERGTYEASGGYPRFPLFEDVELVSRLHRQGRGRRLDGQVISSGRRYRAWGYAATVLKMWSLRIRWWLGASPEELARRYRTS